jgi:hypothetical protein
MAIVRWIRAEGGGTAGMDYHETGSVFERYIRVGTLDGTINEFYLGDWVILGATGDFSPCRAEVFERAYQSA